MRKIVMIALSLLCTSIFSKVCAQCTSGTSRKIINEIKMFIDTVKPMSIFYGKFNVYVLKYNKYVDTQNKKCFTLCYIKNEVGLEYIYYVDSYFMLGSEIVLLRAKDIAILDPLSDIKLIKIDSTNFKNVILKKMANSKVRGTPKSEVLCLENGIMTKTFYRNSDEMPENQSIFDIHKIREGIIIREIPPPTPRSKIR